MYNLGNLNDYEFEILCKDIMEKKLNTKLHRFAKGRDGGVDLCNDTESTIIQVRHYFKSTVSSLITSLKKEVQKVEKLNPKEYYICCSTDLTLKNKKQIRALFKNYMKDISYIVDGISINDFLNENDNKEIVEKNYKLWLCSTNILSTIQNQNIFIDCNEILDDIKKYTKLFVSTEAYYECISKLTSGNIIIITGAPGVGKSTISKMLLLYFANKDYIVRYVSNNDIVDIKRSISRDSSKKEIILLDDFLGQHYLKLNDKQPNELKTLISYIENNPNKKIIMNSRITIMNEASNSSIDFSNLLEKYEENEYLIDLDNMSYMDKACILYNHLYFNDLPVEYLYEVKRNQNYIKIVKHKNYNPRTIEYVTKKRNYESVPSNEYVQYVIKKLDNPDSVWDDEFRNRLEEEDRILMNTLYSLTNDKIETKILEKAYNKRILSITNKTTLNIFNDVIKRLNESLIKIVIDKSKRYISVINPSLNDYLREKILSNHNEQIMIIKNAAYIEQLIKFNQNKDEISKLFFNNNICNLDIIDKDFTYRYFKLLMMCEIKDLKIKPFVDKMFEKLCDNSYFFRDDLIIELIDNNYVSFYGLEVIILKKIKDVIHNFYYNNFLEFLKWVKAQRITFNNNNILIIKTELIDSAHQYIIDELNDEIQDITLSHLRSCDYNTMLYNDGSEPDLTEVLYSCIEDDVKQQIDERIKNVMDDVSGINLIKLQPNDFDKNFLLSNIDINDTIISCAENEEYETQIDNYIESGPHDHVENEWDTINQMFE